MSAVLGPLLLDQLPKSKPVTPMFSCLVSPWDRRPQAFTACSRYRLNAPGPTAIPPGASGPAEPTGQGGGQRPGAERRKPAAKGAAEAWGDPVNSTAAKAMSPRYPTNQVAHF